MFGLFKKSKHPDKFLEYFYILQKDLKMKEPYISSFIQNKSDELSKTDYTLRNNFKTSNMSSSLKSIINEFGFEYCTISFLCQTIYMKEFKIGKIPSRNFEYSVIGLLLIFSDIVDRIDRNFIKFIVNKKDEKWPNVDSLVFESGINNAEKEFTTDTIIKSAGKIASIIDYIIDEKGMNFFCNGSLGVKKDGSFVFIGSNKVKIGDIYTSVIPINTMESSKLFVDMAFHDTSEKLKGLESDMITTFIDQIAMEAARKMI